MGFLWLVQYTEVGDETKRAALSVYHGLKQKHQQVVYESTAIALNRNPPES